MDPWAQIEIALVSVQATSCRAQSPCRTAQFGYQNAVWTPDVPYTNQAASGRRCRFFRQ